MSRPEEVTDEQSKLMREGEELYNLVEQYINKLKSTDSVDKYWLFQGWSNLNTGFTEVVRGIMKIGFIAKGETK